MTETYIPINGISQYFLHLPGANGSNDVLLMLHGGPGLANAYIAYYVQPHCGFCNVVFYDQRGAGKTQLKNQSAASDLSMDVLIEDLRQTVAYVKQHYGTDRIFLAGHSWGSMLGTAYILRYPETVAGYIGYGQAVDSAKQDRSWYQFLQAAVQKAGIQDDIAAFNSVNPHFPNVPREQYFTEYGKLFELSFTYDYMVQDIFAIYSQSPTWTEADAAQSATIEALNQGLYADALFGYDLHPITAYDVPVYYVLGRHDEMTSGTLAAAYFDTFTAPQKGLYWVEDAGHLVETDNPVAFFAAVQKILSMVGV